MTRLCSLVVLFTVLCVTMLGCGGSAKSNREPVFKIRGKVTYKGQPVADADVTFTCEEKNRGAFGKTNARGEFQLSTFRPNDGAVAGKHVVTVVKVEATEATKEAPLESAEYNPDAVAKPVSNKGPKNTIPAKYGNAKTSDLFCVVLDDGNNDEVVLELKD